ncbi:phospholipase A1-IIgamma [Ziziphus jujuba]|uniref:Phospholipase A1 n=1 Tax=Ziziphus jujuba TaxID=326968 RepID=A0A6P4AV70_ZIZJJ|nr:phospholipase A1-IIgamma [Ziziphus jujuba]
MASNIAKRWKILSGESEWKGLLSPNLDVDLRHYIIHYGERVQAVYDATIDETKSKNVGLPRYKERNLFAKVGLEIANPYKYEVKKYFYGSTKGIVLNHTINGSERNSNWLGFIAVATDEGSKYLGRRDILISWRGTLLKSEWLIDTISGLVPASDILGWQNNPMVHGGWYSYYTSYDGSKYNSSSCRNQILAMVRELVEQYKEEEMSITVTGHSMGASLATLNATDIVYNGYNKPKDHPNKACPVTAIVFASPRLGDYGFSKVFYSLDKLHALRVRNKYDVVPDSPNNFNYVHVGKELIIDTQKSPYLKINHNELYHVLEVYLHGVAGTQGKDGLGGFKWEAERDLALINKRSDGLKDEYRVIGN